jgi:hypothetical protein
MRRLPTVAASSRLVALVALTSLPVAMLVGCQPADPTSTKAILSDLSPELQTTTERPVDVDRNVATTFDQNGRMFWDDLGRVWMTDRPSILSPYVIVPTSGKP